MKFRRNHLFFHLYSIKRTNCIEVERQLEWKYYSVIIDWENIYKNKNKIFILKLIRINQIWS